MHLPTLFLGHLAHLFFHILLLSPQELGPVSPPWDVTGYPWLNWLPQRHTEDGATGLMACKSFTLMTCFTCPSSSEFAEETHLIHIHIFAGPWQWHVVGLSALKNG